MVGRRMPRGGPRGRLLIPIVVSALAYLGPAAAEPTPNPTWTACTGNCDSGPDVTVDELVKGVNIALGFATLDTCPVFDSDGDEAVTVDELVKAVNNALYGCGVTPPTPAPTHTRTNTATPTQTGTPTHSPTPTTPPPPTATTTPSPTATVSSCPQDFAHDNINASFACVFIGRWHPSCGSDDLVSSFATDGEVIVAIFVDPEVFFGASVTSATRASIEGWFTQPDVSDFQEVHGTMMLSNSNKTFVVDPNSAPFKISNCSFERYEGAFAGLVDLTGAASSPTAEAVLTAFRRQRAARSERAYAGATTTEQPGPARGLQPARTPRPTVDSQ